MRVRISGATYMGDIAVGVCYTRCDQEERQLEEASCLQALVLMEDLNHSDTDWRDNTEGHKQSRRAPER